MNTNEFSSFAKSNCNRAPECNSFVSEELEAEEDEIRRNEEIKQMMHNAFDDLDEDYQSVNSSSYLASLSGCCNSKTTYSEPSPWNHNPNLYGNRLSSLNNQNYTHTENEQQYLTKIQQLESDFNDLQKRFKEEKSIWLKKFFAEEEEKKLAQKKHEEIHKLFDEAQVMLLQRENELKDYQEKLELSEKEKNEGLKEIRLCQLTIEEMELRLRSQEKENRTKKEEVEYLKQKFSDNDEEKFACYEEEIKNLNEKLALKDKKCQDSELQLEELQKLHKSIIAEKSDVISKLSSNLETCQSQCQKLMLNFNRKLDKNNSESRESLPANMKHDSKLFEELFQAYATVKEKSSEITFLQEQLKSCIKQIKSGQETECQNVEDIRTLKEKLANLEAKNEQLVRENQQLRNSKLNVERESIVDHSDDENVSQKLKMLEEQCNKTKTTYFEVCSANEKLLLQNQQLQVQADELKKMLLNPVHDDSSVKKCLRIRDSSHNPDFALDRDIELEILKKKLKECEDQLEKDRIQHAKQLDVLQIGIRDYISSTEAQHQQQLNELEEEYVKKLSEAESKHHEQFNQFETEFKEHVLRVSTEEIKNLSNIFQKHFDDISETMTRLRTELTDKSRSVEVLNKQLESAREELQSRDKIIDRMKFKHDNSLKEWKEQLKTANDKNEKLLLEIDKIYEKYKTTRKVAIDLRQLLIKHQKFYAQTLNEIQNYLNETLEGKLKDEKSTTKFDITKEDLIVPDEEINSAIFAIKKVLDSLKQCK
ncbi:uncharacterized protein LOC135843739 isoform X2 [Planococcus citri]|uniref:uncharacterized protein LOC135843739 isoform X2 n=1 Tax=Planococcus citri TaxID=170843 RepID=UPI0031F88E93